MCETLVLKIEAGNRAVMIRASVNYHTVSLRIIIQEIVCTS